MFSSKVFFLKLVTVGEAPTDFVLLTTEPLHLCYIGLLGPPAMIDTKLAAQTNNEIREERMNFLRTVMDHQSQQMFEPS